MYDCPMLQHVNGVGISNYELGRRTRLLYICLKIFLHIYANLLSF